MNPLPILLASLDNESIIIGGCVALLSVGMVYYYNNKNKKK